MDVLILYNSLSCSECRSLLSAPATHYRQSLTSLTSSRLIWNSLRSRLAILACDGTPVGLACLTGDILHYSEQAGTRTIWFVYFSSSVSGSRYCVRKKVHSSAQTCHLQSAIRTVHQYQGYFGEQHPLRSPLARL